jgi:hypothetical protein
MSREPGVCIRIRLLVVAHLILATAPMLGLMTEFSMATLPLRWALVALPFGSLMALSVWVGLGRTRLLWRIALGMAGGFYVSFWPFLQEAIEDHDAAGQPIYLTWNDWIIGYLDAVTGMGTLLLLFSVTFMLLRLRYTTAIADPGSIPPREERLQFSMFHIMVVMSVIAVVLSLLRATRHTTAADSTWDWLAMNAFMFVIFFVNTACAAFAALGPSKVKRNVGMVAFVSLLLGIAVAIAMHQDQTNWWLFAGSMMLAIIPTVIVLASSLVARSCGFRLVRRENGIANSR